MGELIDRDEAIRTLVKIAAESRLSISAIATAIGVLVKAPTVAYTHTNEMEKKE